MNVKTPKVLMKSIIYSLTILATSEAMAETVVQTVTTASPPPAITMSICSIIAQNYRMVNDQKITLQQAKALLSDMSSNTTLMPRATAENMMKLTNADGMVFHCKDRSTLNDFTSVISFSYMVDHKPVESGNLLVRAVPPSEPRPMPLPPAPPEPTPKVKFNTPDTVPNAAPADTTQSGSVPATMSGTNGLQ